MRWRRVAIGLAVIAAIAGGIAFFAGRDRLVIGGNWVRLKLKPHATLAERLAEIGPSARARLNSRFERAGLVYPPEEIALVAIKDVGILEFYARSADTAWRRVHVYPVLAQSGSAGPKLRQGDHQVPEGDYRISFLNPNSLYHVSLRLDYPNAFDRHMAARDGRTNLGGDIMIHGKAASVGCLAMGDPAAEELFVAVADVSPRKVGVLVVPTDFRLRRGPVHWAATQPRWIGVLYEDLRRRIAAFPTG